MAPFSSVRLLVLLLNEAILRAVLPKSLHSPQSHCRFCLFWNWISFGGECACSHVSIRLSEISGTLTERSLTSQTCTKRRSLHSMWSQLIKHCQNSGISVTHFSSLHQPPVYRSLLFSIPHLQHSWESTDRLLLILLVDFKPHWATELLKRIESGRQIFAWRLEKSSVQSEGCFVVNGRQEKPGTFPLTHGLFSSKFNIELLTCLYSVSQWRIFNWDCCHLTLIPLSVDTAFIFYFYCTIEICEHHCN